ncbi:hypothetical protein CsSME_00020599 [Camellia sinensis var. sinensis]
MAESVVAFAIKGLGVLAIQNAQFLYGMSDQMQCFLKDADAKQDEHETIHNLVAEIREVAYNAEAVVETFVFEILIRSVNILSEVLARYRIQSEIETIKKNINFLISSLQSYGNFNIGDLIPMLLKRILLLLRRYTITKSGKIKL